MDKIDVSVRKLIRKQMHRWHRPRRTFSPSALVNREPMILQSSFRISVNIQQKGMEYFEYIGTIVGRPLSVFARTKHKMEFFIPEYTVSISHMRGAGTCDQFSCSLIGIENDGFNFLDNLFSVVRGKCVFEFDSAMLRFKVAFSDERDAVMFKLMAPWEPWNADKWFWSGEIPK